MELTVLRDDQRGGHKQYIKKSEFHNLQDLILFLFSSLTFKKQFFKFPAWYSTPKKKRWNLFNLPLNVGADRQIPYSNSDNTFEW